MTNASNNNAVKIASDSADYVAPTWDEILAADWLITDAMPIRSEFAGDPGAVVQCYASPNPMGYLVVAWHKEDITEADVAAANFRYMRRADFISFDGHTTMYQLPLSALPVPTWMEDSKK